MAATLDFLCQRDEVQKQSSHVLSPAPPPGRRNHNGDRVASTEIKNRIGVWRRTGWPGIAGRWDGPLSNQDAHPRPILPGFRSCGRPIASVAAARAMMVMPHDLAMPAISAIVAAPPIIPSAVIAGALHPAAFASVHPGMPPFTFTPRHPAIVMGAAHIASAMLVHGLASHRIASATMRAAARPDRLYLGKSGNGKRQRADSGECHYLHGISPRNRRGGARMMDDWRRCMFQLRNRPIMQTIMAAPANGPRRRFSSAR